MMDYELAQSLAAELTEVAAELRSFIGEVREELLAEILELKRRVAELERERERAKAKHSRARARKEVKE